VELIESELEKPLHWRKPRRIFVCSLSDLFHEALSNRDIDRVFTVMALRPQHLFLVLTKRAERMYNWFEGGFGVMAGLGEWPLRNVGLGVSVEDNAHINRLGWLERTPAALRFMSGEPMLSGIDIWPYLKSLDWVICGGETGPGARPMHPGWARRLRDDCQAAGTPYFFKAWGEWGPTPDKHDGSVVEAACVNSAGEWTSRKTRLPGPFHNMIRVGRKAAGRLIDEKEWAQMPEVK
jgi:protein gp37